jgi:drug/metabolite transporter (DMT)-like permease
MLAAFITTIFFSISIICASRSARLIGGTEANFWRLSCAAAFLAVWAYGFGGGMSGGSFPIFFLSGVIGIGVGDVALFQTLPRLGSRLTLLLVQCLTAPFGALIEWLWLGTTLSPGQMICGAIILAGIGISLAPGEHLHVRRGELVSGIIFSVVAALGGAVGAVLSRKAYAVAAADHEIIDAPTAAFQRVVGGVLLAGLCLLVVKRRHIAGNPEDTGVVVMPAREKWRRVWPWVVANSLAGQTIGVSCYQWAFQIAPTGIVLPIVATTPLVAIPFALWMEGERPGVRSIIGGIIAVAGVAGLAWLQSGHK